ncbi:TetR/AcrR family transcriptional regulator [Amycolatopsis benzoatilytica]|uniref:TetR/AcrR family transcriptional regulator n=1 Tax=Amycolatopsis benzoatilytica TaxID=346045 RepID=UPI00048461FD|nr:TetR/AcrR family transcriptional regulator [Amycolatopsis benzoatilytica]
MVSPSAARIAAAARELLVAEGSSAVTMRRVAAAVGLTPMSIYRHFPNREALLGALADESCAALEEEWGEREWPSEPEAYQREFDSMLAKYLDFAVGQPNVYSLLFIEKREGVRQFPEDFRAGTSATLTALADALSAGMKAGIFREDDVWELAIAISALLHGLVQLRVGNRLALGEKEFRELCRVSVGRVLDGIRC